MLRKLAARWWRITACLLLCTAPIAGVWAQGSHVNASDVAWVSPAVTSIKSLGAISPTSQTEDINNLNYDCLPETYRYQGDLTGTMHDGCFVTTAFGSVDVRNGVVNMTGVDGAIPLRAPGGYTVLPVPGAAGMAAVSGAIPSGSYLHIYTYLPSQVELRYDWLLQPYLQLPTTGSFALSDTSGSPIIINAQSMAYSTNGSWMVVESPWHSFLRINMATFDILPFAPSFSGEPYDLAQHNSQVAITDDGRYVAIASDEFNTLKVYDLAGCSSEINELTALNCPSHEYHNYIAGQIPGWHLTRHLRFINDDLINFHANGNSYVLAPSSSINNLTEYLGLGDSYSSGEGEFRYRNGTDTPNNKCHQSGNSYPYLLTHDIFGDGHSVACSGAVINDVTSKNLNYSGQVQDKIIRKNRSNIDSIFDNFLPGYIAQWEFAQKYQPRVMTVGVGGNDIGFADIIKACIEPRLGNNTCFASYEDRKELTNLMDRTYSKWTAMYRQLQNTAPNTRLYAIGYPQIAAVGGDCGVNVHLNASELQFAHDLVDYLNSVIQKAAADSGITYVDISRALDGHRLCEASGASVAVNGLTAGNDNLHIIGNESYHPNALGHELIEQAILQATHNFSDLAESSPVAAATEPSMPDSAPLLSAPKTSRNLRTVIPDDSIAGGPVSRGSGLFLAINGIRNGLQPNSIYTISLRGDNTILGTLATDSHGNIENTVMVPTDASVGNQILDVIGTNLAGQGIDITTTVYVAADATDSDGDGVANQQDSCPYIVNSSQDIDNDGIDDACDGLIMPTTGSTPTDSSSGSQASIPNTPNSSNTGVTASTVTTTPAEILTATTPPSSLSIASTRNKASANVQQSASGNVLGRATTTPWASPSTKEDRSIATKDNLLTVHWLPWVVDTLLLGLLLVLLGELFGRLTERA